MKPRLRLSLGMWMCGLVDHPRWAWSIAMTPAEAYALWKRVQR
jgi:hypothetical protein